MVSQERMSLEPPGDWSVKRSWMRTELIVILKESPREILVSEGRGGEVLNPPSGDDSGSAFSANHWRRPCRSHPGEHALATGVRLNWVCKKATAGRVPFMSMDLYGSLIPCRATQVFNLQKPPAWQIQPRPNILNEKVVARFWFNETYCKYWDLRVFATLVPAVSQLDKRRFEALKPTPGTSPWELAGCSFNGMNRWQSAQQSAMN